MKLREKIKRFWTLNVHNHEGFTLVELIIVIAILAILSSVAVVGYSSYVTKANIQADKALVSEITNALTMAYYSEGFDGTAAIILQAGKPATIKGGSDAANAWIDKALKTAYGDSYASALQLKYSDWGDGAAVAQDVLAYFVSVGSDNALYGIYNGIDVPSFAGKVDDLFVLVKDTAIWVGDSLDMSGAALVQNAALLTANGTVTADEFATKWASSAWDNNFLMGTDGGSYGADVSTTLKDDALKNAVANAGVLKARNISIASYLSSNNYPELYSIFADFNYAGTAIPADSAAVLFEALEGKNTDDTTALMNQILAACNNNTAKLNGLQAVVQTYFSEQAYKDGLAYFAMMDTVNNVNNEPGATDEEYWDDMESAVNLYGSIARGEASLPELNNVYSALNGIAGDAIVVTIMSPGENLVISVSPKAASSSN